MDSEILSSINPKECRIMIITANEQIIEQIESITSGSQANTNYSTLTESIFLESKNEKSQHNSSLNNQAKPRIKKRTRDDSLTCVVCGSPALGYNFDAITCESCKAFFRRNALKSPETLKCRRRGGCEITFETRRRCSACRLVKCFRNGMKRGRLLLGEENVTNCHQIEDNRNIKFVSHLNTTTDNKQNILPSKRLNHIPIFEETRISHSTNFPKEMPQSREEPLSLEDLKFVKTIQLLYEQRITIAAQEGLPWNPSMPPRTFLQHMNFHSVTLLRLLAFFKQIPEFCQLNVDDKVILVKHNLMSLLIFNCTLSYRKEKNGIIETDSDVPWDEVMLKKVQGLQNYMKIRKIFNSLLQIAYYDQHIIHLILIIFIFNKGVCTDYDVMEPMLNDAKAVCYARNYYTELLWKYMVSVHGYNRSIHIYNELIFHFMSWQTIETQLRLNVKNNLTELDTNQLLPIIKTLLHIS